MISFKKFFEESTDDQKKALLRKLKDLATPTTISLKEPTPVVPKGRPRGSKQKMSRKEMKHEMSIKRDLSGFEFAKTIEERELAANIPDKSSQISNARKKKKEVVKPPGFMSYIPKFMHEFIAEIIDVQDDGNCGFRCVGQI